MYTRTIFLAVVYFLSFLFLPLPIVIFSLYTWTLDLVSLVETLPLAPFLCACPCACFRAWSCMEQGCAWACVCVGWRTVFVLSLTCISSNMYSICNVPYFTLIMTTETERDRTCREPTHPQYVCTFASHFRLHSTPFPANSMHFFSTGTDQNL